MNNFFQGLLNLVAGRGERRFGSELLQTFGIRLKEPETSQRSTAEPATTIGAEDPTEGRESLSSPPPASGSGFNED